MQYEPADSIHSIHDKKMDDGASTLLAKEEASPRADTKAPYGVLECRKKIDVNIPYSEAKTGDQLTKRARVAILLIVLAWLTSIAVAMWKCHDANPLLLR
eukprot:gene21727-1242_t